MLSELLFSASTMIVAYVGCNLLTPSFRASKRLTAGALTTEASSNALGTEPLHLPDMTRWFRLVPLRSVASG